MGVLPGKIIDFKLVYISLLVEALHGYREEVARLAIIERSHGDFPRLQLTGGLPLSD
ncbi:hypothetical protein D3C76_1881600 [compost metagenome]